MASSTSGLRARVNLSYVAAGEDPRPRVSGRARRGRARLRHLGMRDWPYMLSNAVELAIRIGDWDWARWPRSRRPPASRRTWRRGCVGPRSTASVAPTSTTSCRRIADSVADMTEVQAQASVDEVRAVVALAPGDDTRSTRACAAVVSTGPSRRIPTALDHRRARGGVARGHRRPPRGARHPGEPDRPGAEAATPRGRGRIGGPRGPP